MQRAFYYDGKSLSDPTTYQEIAVTHDLDPDLVLSRMEEINTISDAQRDFTLVKQLNVHSYPTLLLQKDKNYFNLGSGAMTVENLEANLTLIYAASKEDESPEGMTCDIVKGSC